MSLEMICPDCGTDRQMDEGPEGGMLRNCPNCSSSADPILDTEKAEDKFVGLIFRLYLNGKLALREVCSRPGDAEKAGERQVRKIEEAERHGKTWLVEVEDPDQPVEKRFVRFGTDSHGMVYPEPNPVSMVALEKRLHDLVEGRL